MSNEFADGFQAEPPLVAPSIPVPDDDTVDDDPRDIYNSIVMSGQPDTPLRSTQLDPGDLMPRGEDPLLPDSPPSLPSIPDLPPGQLAMFSHLPPPSPPEAEDVSIAGPEADLGDLTGEQKGFDTPIDAFGRYEAFLARVRSVHYLKTNGHPVARMKQAVDYERVAVWYDTNNEPSVGAVGPTHSRPIPAVGYATPFPVRHDQTGYLVKRGDIVTIVQSEDRAYYLVDELPFLAQVMSHVDVDYVVAARQDAQPASAFETDQYLVGASATGTNWTGQSNKIATYTSGAWVFVAPANGTQVYAVATDNYWLKAGGTWSTTTNVKESNNGGAGNKTLRVIRKALSVAPGSATVAGMADLQTAASVDVEYEHVMPVGPSNSAHGYRVGDPVWVFRRGDYLFCLKSPKIFVAALQVGAGTGPDGEADFATNHYWFKEQVPTITYANNAWTVSWAAVSATDPTGSGGRWGRWGDAVNLDEGASDHGIAHGTLVSVHDVGDAASGEIGYVFSKADVPNIPTSGLVTNGIVTYNGTTFTTPSGNTGDIMTQDADAGWTPKAPSVISAIPTGVVFQFAGDYDDVPSGFLFCDGSEVLRTSALGLVIGDKYGVGNGTTTYNIPDTCGKTHKGATTTEARDNATARGNALHGGAGGGSTNNHTTHASHAMTGARGYTDVGGAGTPGIETVDHDLHSETDNWPPHWIGPCIIKT